MRIITFLAAILLSCNDTNISSHDQSNISVRFSPKGGITQAIVEGIDNTKSEIKIQAFSFTSPSIANALIKAKQNGKSVEAVVDRENLHNKSSVINSLYNNEIIIYIDDKHAIAHNKVLVIDKKIVFTGSFNLTRAGEEHNAENSIKIENENIASLYVENYNLHKNHSYLYSPDR